MSQDCGLKVGQAMVGEKKSSCCSLGPAVLPGPVSNNWVRWCVGLQVDIGQSTVMAISFRYICTVLNWIKE